MKEFADGVREPLNTGGNTEEERTREFFDIIQLVHDRRMQLGIHVIGALDTETAVKAIVAAQHKNAIHDSRHYVIHGSLLSRDTLHACADAGIGITTQPAFFTEGEPPSLPDTFFCRSAGQPISARSL